MYEKEIEESIRSAIDFMKRALEDQRERREKEFDLNLWKAMDAVEYAAFLFSLNEIHSPLKVGNKNEAEGNMPEVVTLLEEALRILPSDVREAAKKVWNAKRRLLKIEKEFGK